MNTFPIGGEIRDLWNEWGPRLPADLARDQVMLHLESNGVLEHVRRDDIESEIDRIIGESVG